MIERISDDQLEIGGAVHVRRRASERRALRSRTARALVPATSFVAGALNEISHHGSQICTLRDLFAAQR